MQKVQPLQENWAITIQRIFGYYESAFFFIEKNRHFESTPVKIIDDHSYDPRYREAKMVPKKLYMKNEFEFSKQLAFN